MKNLKLKMLTAVITLTAISASAQEEEPEQKKWNFGFHLGSDQFYTGKAPSNPFNYQLDNTHSYKMGILAERNLNEKSSVTLGLNYNLYFQEHSTQYAGYGRFGGRTLDNYFDLDIQYNRYLVKNLNYFVGTNVSFQRGHSNYGGGGGFNNGIGYSVEGKATDFNVGLNTGLKYTLNPKSKFKIEPYVMIGVNAFSKEKEEVIFTPSNQTQQHTLSNFYTRFGVNFKF